MTEFERRVREQQSVGAGHYDAEYFTGDWRDAGNNYSLGRVLVLEKLLR